MAGSTADLGPGLHMSREEYRRWAEAQSRGRFERIDGEVVAMAPERAGHADRKALAWLALRQAVTAAGLPCHVRPDGMTVEADDSDFEPDAVLLCGEPFPTDAIAVPDPLVVVEVLSPGTRGDDGRGIDTRVVAAGELRLDPPGITILVEDIYAT
jgi:Uma2 family endonuclease